MATVRRMTIELIAPIEQVWSALAGADGWSVSPDGEDQVTVVEARAPDRVSWHVTGGLRGAVEWELDDLDAITFAYGTWEVGSTRTRHTTSEKAAQRAHDLRASTAAALLADAVGADLLTVRSDMRRPRQTAERPRRAAGAMLLGAAWLAGRGPRD